MDTHHINWKALIHYLSGECSNEEKEVIEQWIRMDPRNEEFILFLKKIWESSAEKKGDWDVDSAWSRFNQNYRISDSHGLADSDDSDGFDRSDPSSDFRPRYLLRFFRPGKSGPAASSESGKPGSPATSESNSSKTDDPFHSSEIRELSYREMKEIGSGVRDSHGSQDSQDSQDAQGSKGSQNPQGRKAVPRSGENSGVSGRKNADSPGAQTSTSFTPQKRNAAWKTWFGVVACIMLIFSGLYFSEITPPVHSVEQTTNYREIVTENGQRTRVNLSDGSSVILNTGSRLTIPETFADQESREVTLTGEAFFEVKHRPDLPFIVHSGQTQTEVLGTTFQVRSFTGSERTEVVVTEGSVVLYKPNQTDQQKVVITESQLGVWTTSGGDLYDLEDPSLYTGWKDGRLIFYHESLELVTEKLKKWYDADVKIEGENPAILRRELTAEFSETQSMQEVFEAIALALEIRYRSDGSTYTFYQ